MFCFLGNISVHLFPFLEQSTPTPHRRSERWPRPEWESCCICHNPRLKGSGCVQHQQAGAHSDSNWWASLKQIKKNESMPNSCLNEWLADNATNTYLEDIALDRESRMLYLTSKTEGSLMRVEAKEGAKLELFLTNKASRPTGITIDPCSRSLDFIED